jgi:hypothetical protein
MSPIECRFDCRVTDVCKFAWPSSASLITLAMRHASHGDRCSVVVTSKVLAMNAGVHNYVLVKNTLNHELVSTMGKAT